jgi:hypothetical protein
MLHRCFIVTAMLLAAVSLAAQPTAPSPQEAKTALRKATDYLTAISTEGGYLWRYSEDLRERQGEGKATPTQIWVQPPGTPSIGMTFLDAYAATQDERHLAAAQAAAFALVRGQLESGGWDYLIEFDPKARRAWAYRSDSLSGDDNTARRKNTTTFDDDNTQSALRFLIAFLATATNRPAADLKVIRETLDYGLEGMLAAQYPNGAWPQRHTGRPHKAGEHVPRPAQIPKDWPRAWPKADYGAFYTLNDHTQQDCIRTMLDAHRSLGAEKYLQAALRGGEFFVRAQLPEPQPAWAQQYNFNMEPAWARAFEPPAACSAESAGVMHALVDLYLETGDEKFLKPAPAFIAWSKRSQVAPGQWARFYELETNRPIYGDRDGKIHYTLEEISEERRRGYAWQGGFGVPGAISYYETVRADGREQFLAKRTKQVNTSKPLPREVAEIISRQDAQGRWVNEGWVEMRRFSANMRKLSDYLNASARTPDR